MLNFSWATDLDPKGANNHIKEAIDRRYITDEDEDPSLDTSVCKFYSYMLHYYTEKAGVNVLSTVFKAIGT